jgi:hypothetical protein
MDRYYRGSSISYWFMCSVGGDNVMTIRLWVDDERPNPMGWLPVTTSRGAIEWLSHMYAHRDFPNAWAHFESISFDHDLGGDDTTMPVLDWMVEHDFWPKRVYVHTANPIGRSNLLRTLSRFAPDSVEIYELWQNPDGTFASIE